MNQHFYPRRKAGRAGVAGQRPDPRALGKQAVRQFATGRFPPPVVEDLLRNWAQSVGRTAFIAPDLEKIIGRPVTTYAQWAAQHANAYR